MPKSEIKTLLMQSSGDHTLWNRAQAYIYTVGIEKAVVAEGFFDFVETVNREDLVEWVIVSHKSSKLHFEDLDYGHFDLREVATRWLQKNKVFEAKGFKGIQFSDTKDGKIEIINSLNLDAFVDDLEEIFQHPKFPKDLMQFLYAPLNKSIPKSEQSARTFAWSEIKDSISAKITDYPKLLSLFPQLCFKDMKMVRGGLNNRCYTIEHENQGYFVKIFAEVDSMGRDRFTAELNFREYYCDSVVKDSLIPLVNYDKKNRVMSFPIGTPTAKGTLAVDQAVDFIAKLSAVSRAKKVENLNWASEAHQSIPYSMANLQKRIVNISKFVPSEWKEKLDFSFKELERKINFGNSNLFLSEDEYINSPSDFGFHNSVNWKGKLFFCDFEYAGKDHPTKLLADFILHPEFNLSISDIQYITIESERIFGHDGFSEKLELALAIFSLKWVVTLLGDYSPEVNERRKAALNIRHIDFDKRIKLQEKKSARMLERHRGILAGL